MLSRDLKGILGGAILALIGVWYAYYAYTHYDLGSVRRMGPGMFPFGLGIILAIFGTLITLPSFFRSGTRFSVDVISAAVILTAIAAFALSVRPFGLLPATVLVIVISSFARGIPKLRGLAILCVNMCILTWLIFNLGLRLPIPLVRWPF